MSRIEAGHAAGTSSRRLRVLVLVGVGLAAASVALALPPIPQDPAYHCFADQRRLLGVPNLLNVISNVPFVLIGALGLRFALRREGDPRPDGPVTSRWERGTLGVLFAGMALVGFGSAWYHLQPSNGTLVWDRLPMTIVFMALFALTIEERVDRRAGRLLLPVVLLVGAGSVVWWRVGELRGAGDLRLYGLVQFLPMVAIPLALWLFPPRYTRGADFVVALGWYAAAKLFESLDAATLALGHFVSGHTLKHLAAAAAMAWLLRMVERRRPIPSLGSVTPAT